MANSIFMKITGKIQGLISEGCLSIDSVGNKHISGHEDEIFVYATNYDLSRDRHVNHHPFSVTKVVDKSTPLVLTSIANNKLLEVELRYYRTSASGTQENYMTITLRDASIVNISNQNPNSLTHNDMQPFETLSLRYESITCQHNIAGTSGYSILTENMY
ncbi:Hcp family type VI secretion system effector [Pectobacterium aquaticum]|uniref:Hcp family type VI secretion system effector n=1 Tax=Pectobacterium aquaticum TaxID=2204145 RepID=A0A3R8QRJ1_9GAMM|nr:Hcp family type VI secretion system effector [Pectobacterium aquaticum]RRN99374.1 Hcp family type VI secretion system effector [Pectobacterium aquaticum]RRO08945.1 Hcp family type VI secretion system effector [Pectobacterium aquaticum]